MLRAPHLYQSLRAFCLAAFAADPQPQPLLVANPQAFETLLHPNCVLNILRRHYARYTPEMVASICGCTREQLLDVAEQLMVNSGRERTSAIVYAVGWTQHSTGPEMIRAAAILQLLLGNTGRPGGGVMAMRGHCSIQGSTDIPTLYNLLPGYIPQPARARRHNSLQDYFEQEKVECGYWANFPKFMISLLKAWYGDAATKENDWGFRWVPRITADVSELTEAINMAEGRVQFVAYPHNVFFPGVFLAVTVLAVNILGDGLRDTLDPKMAKRV